MRPRSRKRKRQWEDPTGESAAFRVDLERGDRPPKKPKRRLRVTDDMFAAILTIVNSDGVKS